MSALGFRFIASPETVASILELGERQQVTLSQPQPFDNTSEPLNAPISGDNVMHAAQILSAIFASGSAAVVFFDKVIDLVRKTKQPVEVRRPEDGRRIQIGPDTTRDSIKEVFPDV